MRVPILALALSAALSACAGPNPYTGSLSGEGACVLVTDARWLLVSCTGGGSADAHIKAAGEPIYLAQEEVEAGGWYLLDLTGEAGETKLPSPPAPWPLWVYDLYLRTDAWYESYGITFEQAPE